MTLSTKIEKILSKSQNNHSKFVIKITNNSQFSILHTHLENAVMIKQYLINLKNLIFFNLIIEDFIEKYQNYFLILVLLSILYFSTSSFEIAFYITYLKIL